VLVSEHFASEGSSDSSDDEEECGCEVELSILSITEFD